MKIHSKGPRGPPGGRMHHTHAEIYRSCMSKTQRVTNKNKSCCFFLCCTTFGLPFVWCRFFFSPCLGPSPVTHVISSARSTSATSACERQGLCVVAWYSSFSWLGINPHYSAFQAHTHTLWHTHTHTNWLPWSASRRFGEECLWVLSEERCKNREELLFLSSFPGVSI